MNHSKIVGGSSAARVIACPGSVKLCAKMPPKPSSSYADEGTLLHNAIAEVLLTEPDVTLAEARQSVLGMYLREATLTPELYDERITPALDAIDEIDPTAELDYAVEQTVDFGDYLPGVFGSVDLIGRIGGKAIVLDWKFGSGVPVSAEKNAQLMFYAAAAMRTPAAQAFFEYAEEIELIIVQPTMDPVVSRWATTRERIAQFERELKQAVTASEQDDAPLIMGDHCRWCAAKPICPQMNGAVDRALRTQMQELQPETIAHYLQQADLLEPWIADLRALALRMQESGVKVPGHKLVAKRGQRKWADEKKATLALLDAGLTQSEVVEKTLVSPAKAEALLKKRKQVLPDGSVVSISSGNTLVPESDPRPEVMLLGQQLKAALAKLN